MVRVFNKVFCFLILSLFLISCKGQETQVELSQAKKDSIQYVQVVGDNNIYGSRWIFVFLDQNFRPIEQLSVHTESENSMCTFIKEKNSIYLYGDGGAVRLNLDTFQAENTVKRGIHEIKLRDNRLLMYKNGGLQGKTYRADIIDEEEKVIFQGEDPIASFADLGQGEIAIIQWNEFTGKLPEIVLWNEKTKQISSLPSFAKFNAILKSKELVQIPEFFSDGERDLIVFGLRGQLFDVRTGEELKLFDEMHQLLSTTRIKCFHVGEKNYLLDYQRLDRTEDYKLYELNKTEGGFTAKHLLNEKGFPFIHGTQYLSNAFREKIKLYDLNTGKLVDVIEQKDSEKEYGMATRYLIQVGK